MFQKQTGMATDVVVSGVCALGVLMLIVPRVAQPRAAIRVRAVPIQAARAQAPAPVPAPEAVVPAAAPALTTAQLAAQCPDVLAGHDIPLRSDTPQLTNIDLAAQAVDGAVVAPGQEFSFNQVVGERTQERGFQPAAMYQNGTIVQGVGGGICVVATALYRVVLDAGLQIMERAHHSGPVHYAQPGLDCAVAYGVLDLRFRNSLDAPVMVRAQVKDGVLHATVLGRAVPGRRVIVQTQGYQPLAAGLVTQCDPTLPAETAEVAQAGRPGFRVDTFRRILQPGRPPVVEHVSSDVVLPRDACVKVSPDLAEAGAVDLASLGLDLDALPAGRRPNPDGRRIASAAPLLIPLFPAGAPASNPAARPSPKGGGVRPKARPKSPASAQVPAAARAQQLAGNAASFASRAHLTSPGAPSASNASGTLSQSSDAATGLPALPDLAPSLDVPVLPSSDQSPKAGARSR